ncbi:MAG: hypothetical protein EOQ92_28375 [Mesorhizobium sp.]|nr:MAG: hypothetical protein EOQ92_28375 [Mesorhizobium sp.]RWK47315.1 MAG: hypothetical protein EOR47_22410 [Mesorhizobium sp.]RWK94680.1 MAG: hypothetical protein EOR53_17530 [Mesorhizobium sp.]RWL13272.1 MAG: hypothetical protein EOR45_02510 [Mesorhizobium sp.]TIP61056.1 MAG: hypothetical protein E5X56_02910 [Mesorhizobium sp.]
MSGRRSVSTVTIALSFVAQVTKMGMSFVLFSLILLPERIIAGARPARHQAALQGAARRGPSRLRVEGLRRDRGQGRRGNPPGGLLDSLHEPRRWFARPTALPRGRGVLAAWVEMTLKLAHSHAKLDHPRPRWH